MNQKAVGTGGFLLSWLILAALSTFSFYHLPATRIEGDLGLCLHSPNRWNLTPLISWIVNTGVIAFIAISILLMNRRYNFIRGHDLVTPCAYLVLTACTPWTTQWLGASSLLTATNLLCWSILFTCFRSRNATQQVFIAASVLSIGSMIQYAFIFMIPIYFIALMILKTLRWKEFIAMGLGLVAPYWIALGFGIVTPENFSFPTITNLFTSFAPQRDLMIMLTGIGVTMLIAMVAAFNNAIKLFAGNSRILALNNVITLVGVGCAVLIVLDFNNMLAYLGTFYLCVSVQAGNIFALRNIRNPQYILGPLLILYLTLYGLMVWPF